MSLARLLLNYHVACLLRKRGYRGALGYVNRLLALYKDEVLTTLTILRHTSMTNLEREKRLLEREALTSSFLPLPRLPGCFQPNLYFFDIHRYMLAPFAAFFVCYVISLI